MDETGRRWKKLLIFEEKLKFICPQLKFFSDLLFPDQNFSLMAKQEDAFVIMDLAFCFVYILITE